jgi:tetrahydromethanopterin S-methyltransferase subunit G
LNKIFNPFRIIFYLLNIVITIVFIFIIFSNKGIKQNDNLEKLVISSKERYGKIQEEYNDLKRKIEFFNKNEYYQVMVIHKEIGYISEDERIYIFEDK